MTAYYMHLDSYSNDILTASKGDQSMAGQVIGYVGDSGSASTTHLRFEIRVGSRYSLSHQLDIPTSLFAYFGQDPHVYPLGLFPAPTVAAGQTQLSVGDNVTASQDGVIEVSVVDEHPVANQYELLIYESLCAQTPIITVLDYNLRQGFNASSTTTIDDPQLTTGMSRISPLSFVLGADTWTVHYVIPTGFSTKGTGERFQLVVTDVYDDNFTVFTDAVTDNW